MQNKTRSNVFMKASKRSNHCDLMNPFDWSKSGAKVFLLCLSALFTLVWCSFAESQESIHHPRIGFLASGGPRLPFAFHEGLRELGYIEGKNIFIEYRYSKGQSGRLLKFAEELVRLKVNIIIAPNTPSTEAAKQSTSKIPIVMLSAFDPVLGLSTAWRDQEGTSPE
jgi:ABC-type uncharacterized transport system substrate-binding protein